ncbi:MAG: hypothetical protein J7K96_00295 [Desulfobacteraceae bacterium]|nr:hypothetical protein [Desulfobacteraceae bacterium]
MGKKQVKNQVKNSFLSYLSAEEKEQFLSELLAAAQTGDLSIVEDCLEDWQDIAEMNSIPNLKENAWERFNALKNAGKVCCG